jgi:cytochrome-b5 reductase
VRRLEQLLLYFLDNLEKRIKEKSRERGEVPAVTYETVIAEARGTQKSEYLDSDDSLIAPQVPVADASAGRPSKGDDTEAPSSFNSSWDDTSPLKVSKSQDVLDTDKNAVDVSVSLQLQTAISRPTASGTVLHPAEFRKFVLVKIVKLTPETSRLRFAIAGNDSLNIPIGRHVSVRATINGASVRRAYTPITRPDQPGFFELVVKGYEFGKMSSYLQKLSVGEEIDVRGPVGTFNYKKNSFKHICFLVAGTGLTPALQILTSVLEMREYDNDNTQFSVMYQNRTERDILMLGELRLLHQRFKNRLTVAFFVSNPILESWGERVGQVRGYINFHYIKELSKMDPVPDLFCICGPSGFNASMDSACREAGYDSRSMFIF